MASKKKASEEPESRQAAYTTRNRARLIKDAQELLAESGPSATIEQIATYAEVSPTTIYKYFENKEQLFAAAMNEAWRDFLVWANSQKVPGDRLERVLDSGRKLLWARQSHPLFAKMLHNSLNQMPNFALQVDQGDGKKAFRDLAKSGEVKREDFEERYLLWTHIYTGLLISVFVTEELTPAEAEVAFGIGLSVWGISEAKAKKLMSRPLDFAPLH
jgi:AcrR family transcriptional regulator